MQDGPPRILHSDNGREFVNENISRILDEFKVLHITGTPYTPRVQGQIERFNGTLKNIIRNKRETLDASNFKHSLLKFVYDYNTSRHRATNCTPFKIFKNTGGFNRVLKKKEDVYKENLGDFDPYREKYNEIQKNTLIKKKK